VKDARGPLNGLPHRAAVGDVAGRALELEIAEVLEARASPRQQTQLVATLGKRPNQVRAEKPAASGDQGLGHSGSVRARGRRRRS
jgi:hypothetical protein